LHPPESPARNEHHPSEILLIDECSSSVLADGWRRETVVPIGGMHAWDGARMDRELERGHGAVTKQIQHTEPNGFNYRTQIVWIAFMACMTVFGLFFILTKPDPSRALADLPLASTSALLGPEQVGVRDGFGPQRADLKDVWANIVIHDSGFYFDDAEDIARRHIAGGLQDIGYHFVIGNGNGSLADGQIFVSNRWDQQLAGAHVASRTGADPLEADRINRVAIGICLVGNGEQSTFTPSQTQALANLVTSLQRRLELSDGAVLLHSDLSDVRSPGRFFPAAKFEAHLASTGN
jgi:hypothetical protein